MKQKILTLAAIFATLTVLAFPISALAIDLNSNCGNNGVDCKYVGSNQLNTDSMKSADNPVRNAILAALGLLGAISTIVIVVAGIQMTLSQGEPDKIKKARTTILYAVIGLVVAISAWGIVQFVVSYL